MPFFGSSWNERDNDGSMFGPRLGSWWVSSKTDPRWNKTGRGYGLVVTDGPSEMHTWLEYCRTQYGDPPADCEYGFMKD